MFTTPSQSSNSRQEKPSDPQIVDTVTSHLHTEVNTSTSNEINYEKVLVDDITIPVGIRSAPSTAVLDNFMKRLD